jgi:class 3 adenylate cyclase
LNILLDSLRSRLSFRWLGHGLGLLAGAVFLLCLGEAPRAVLGLALLLVFGLSLFEVCAGLLDRPKRRLIRLAPDCFPLKNLAEDDRAFVQETLARFPSGAGRRAAAAWAFALLAVSLGYGSHPLQPLAADVLFVSLALPVSWLAQSLGNEAMLKRVLPFFYFEENYAQQFGRWLPKQGARLRGDLLAPLAMVFAPLLAAFVLAEPLSLASLGWLALVAVGAALSLAWAWTVLAIEPLQDLQEALQRLGRGDFQSMLDVTGGDELGHATETFNKTARAVDRRLFVVENFGHSVPPAKSEALFEGGLKLDGELRPVAVLAATWHGAEAATAPLEPRERLAALNRFYETVQDAVDKQHGHTLELGGGRLLAFWGAPLPAEGGNAVNAALAAAWTLQAALPVFAQQQQLRHRLDVSWGLGVSSGQALSGLAGPKNRQRYQVLGGPVDEVRRLAAQPGGAWVDERSAAAAQTPFAVQIAAQGAQLIAGPAAEGPASLDFTPGARL